MKLTLSFDNSSLCFSPTKLTLMYSFRARCFFFLRPKCETKIRRARARTAELIRIGYLYGLGCFYCIFSLLCLNTFDVCVCAVFVSAFVYASTDFSFFVLSILSAALLLMKIILVLLLPLLPHARIKTQN